MLPSFEDRDGKRDLGFIFIKAFKLHSYDHRSCWAEEKCISLSSKIRFVMGITSIALT